MAGVGGGGGNDSSCYASMVDPSELWMQPPLLGPLPALVRQMAVTIGSNLFFLVIFHPFHQPRIVRDIVSALVVSPLVVNSISPKASKYLWPKSGTTNLECLANLGVVYAMFIKGLQMDTTPISHGRGGKTLGLLCGIILLPFTIGIAVYLALYKSSNREVYLYWGAILSSTSFDDIVQVLTRLKLLCTDTGIEALSVGMVNDLFSWLFVLIAIGLSALPGSERDMSRLEAWKPFMSVVVFMICFGLLCYFAVRPVIIKVVESGESIGESTIHVMLFTMMVCGLVSELFGAYCLVGALMLGLCIPHGHLASMLVEKMEDCVSGVLMPLFYATIAIKMSPDGLESGYVMIGISILGKPVCVFLMCMLCDIPIHNSFALGTLLSSKGVVSIVIALIGFEHKHLSSKSFTILIMVILFSTIPVGPTMAFIYKNMLRSKKPYKQRTIQHSNDFRVVACIHDSRQIPSIINLVQLANVAHCSPMSLFPLHLLELIGRASTMLISHGTKSGKGGTGQSDPVISAFKTYQQYHAGSTSVETLTVISAVNSMHEDISSVAEDKQANLIILPFHKHQLNQDDTTTSVFRQVNQNVMGTSPCSVALLVDRGLGLLPLTPITANLNSNDDATLTLHSFSTTNHSIRLAMLYFGGTDDREALSLATRISANPQVTNLTVIRFLVGDNPIDMMFPDDTTHEGDMMFTTHEGDNDDDHKLQTIYTHIGREKEIDDAFISEFRHRVTTSPSIDYKERVSNNGEDTLAHLRDINHSAYNLYVVGRGRGVTSPFTAGLTEWSDNPELGAIGDALLTSDFAQGVTILVVQKWIGARITETHPNQPLQEIPIDV